MKKKLLIIVLFLSILVITGCNNNKEEEEKNEYLAMKSTLLENKKYTKLEDLNCEILVNLDRLNEEKIIYKVTLSNPKENMNNIKALVVHNYYTEEVFPSIGLFDKKASLLVNSSDVVELSGTIDTTENINKINLELKIWIQYINDNKEKKDIYYKTT